MNGINFLSSLLLETNGTYKINNIYIDFKKKEHYPKIILEQKNPYLRAVDCFVTKSLENRVFRLILLAPLHVFIHEMGHALAYKILSKANEDIKICIDSPYGVTFYPFHSKFDNGEKMIVDAAGPLLNIFFCTCQLVALRIFKNIIPTPISLITRFGATMYIVGELWYAQASASGRVKGDFGNIAEISKNHLLIANVALISQCILGLLMALDN